MPSRVALVLLALAWLTSLTSVALAAPKVVRGVVVERGTTRPIAGASVLGERGTMAVTDVDGYFAIDIDASTRELLVAANGFVTRAVRVPADGGDLVRVDLVRASGAEVIEVRDRAPDETKPLSYHLTADEIRALPGAGNDILRAVQALPGVARVPYSFGGLVLRGMSPRDSAVYLDGIEVPIAFHFGGLTTFYPGGMLADLTMTSGGFDASYGRTQGGLIAVTTREPRTDRWRIGGSIGLLDSSVQIEGPLPKGGGVIAGLRRSYIDTIVAPFVDADTPLPSYWDFQLRTSWGDPRRSGRITPMLFGSIDIVSSSELSLTSSFVRVAAPMRRQWGPVTLSVVPWIGRNELRFTDRVERQTFSRPAYPGGVRAELVRDWPWGHVRGGVEVTGGYLAQTEIAIAGSEGPQELRGTSTIAWTDVALWSELRYALAGDRIAVKPGVRVEVYGLTTGTPQSTAAPLGSVEAAGPQVVVDPRLNVLQRITETTTLRQAIGRYHQPPTPGDVDPINGNAGLDSSYVDQMSLGVDTALPEDIVASVTGFYHYGRELGVRLRNPRPGSDAPEPNLGGIGPTFELLLEEQLGFAIYRENIGRARSGGVELLLRRSTADSFALVGYTFAVSQRTDDPRSHDIVRDGAWRPFELDQRHNLQVAYSQQVGSWRFGARFQMVSGNPYSPSRITEDGDVVQDPWAGRLPTFVSLDLRIDRRWRRRWAHINVFLDVQNVIDYDNVEGRQFEFEEGGDVDIPGLPIIPFIGIEFLPPP